MSNFAEQFKLYNTNRLPADATRFCHAPFNNLYFGNRGFIMACCSNRLHVLGRYPQQSITDVWTGEKAKNLRASMNNNDFSKGCQACYSVFESGAFGNVPANVYDRHAHVGNYPKRMEFELSNTCNLECVMCTGELSSSIRERRDKKPPIPSPYDDAFLKQLDEYIPHLQTAQFLGGEPFLIPIYFQIWERMTELNPDIRISVQTNGTILNARVKEVLSKLKVSISISIDSIDDEVYPIIRKNGDLARVKQNVEWFSNYVKEKQTSMSISFCPMQQNWMEIPAMVEFANKHNASIFFNSVFQPATCSLMGLPTGKLQEITDYLDSAKLTATTPIEQSNLSRFESIKAFIHGLKSESHTNAEDQLRTNMTLEEYLDEAQNFINHQADLTLEAKQQVFENISGKLHFMMACAEQDGILEEAKRAIVTVSLTNLYHFLPSSEDKERLYVLFKEKYLKEVVQ